MYRERRSAVSVRNSRLNFLRFSLLALIVCVIGISGELTTAKADQTQFLYAMNLNENNIYTIDVDTGTVNTVSTTALFPSLGIASDQRYLYYWNGDRVTQRGIVRWDPLTDTHTMFNTTNISEENAVTDDLGTLWLLDRSDSYDPTIGGFQSDNTGNLYTVDKTTGDRTVAYTLPFGGQRMAVGDITWSNDNRLFISTNNQFMYPGSPANNYIWDEATNTLKQFGGYHYAGLAWIGDKLYGSRYMGGPTGVFELNPDNFSEITQITVMPGNATISDLAVGTVPEPATFVLLSLAAPALIRRRKK